MQLERKTLLHWCASFFLGNIVLYWIIGTLLFPSQSIASTDIQNKFFFLISYLGHFALLAILPAFVIIPLIYIQFSKKFIFIISIILTSSASSLLLIDVLTYRLYQFHLNGIVLDLFFYGVTQDIFGLSFIEKIAPLIILLLFLFIEYSYAKWLWHRSKKKTFLPFSFKIGIIIILGIFSCASYFLTTLNKDSASVRNLLHSERVLPLYIEIWNKLIPENKKNSILIRTTAGKNPLALLEKNAPLNYPIHPLTFFQKNHLMNLVIIVVDAWRFDMVSTEITPAINQFSKEAWMFKNHFSGGNSTEAGIFTLFYGLPATYITAMKNQHQSPLLITELQKHGYQIGLFSSAPLYMPPLNLSVFQSINNLSLKQQSKIEVNERDRLVTENFNQYLDKINLNKPFFSFLFYDAAHSYCGTNENHGPFQPTIKKCNRMTFNKIHDHDLYFNRYKNAVLSIDHQIDKVIHTLRERNLLENTIIMIVGDHGEEFDDNNKGFFGHASNYSIYQTKTPLILYWPQKKSAVFTHKTSHFDIAPTLMAGIFGCKNLTTDYSVGNNLLNKKNRPYFIITSYVDFGIVEPNEIINISPAGNYFVEKINQKNYEPDINKKEINAALNDLQRFFK